tara:strand:- start:2711 stop:3985 length:1275 start_codon:yes stop_codon:yes gene_type:complete
MNKKLILIELNEFNKELLEKAVIKLNLPNIKYLLSLKYTKTYSVDLEEHQGLDPWVQWVSIHTGVPLLIHKVKRLGEVPNLKNAQIWEELSEKGITSGVWGAMNASKNDSKGCKFFLPDPWTFSESAFPEKLNRFLSLPRYYAKNYIKPSIFSLVKTSLKTASVIFDKIYLISLVPEISYSLLSLFKHGIHNYVLFSLFDLISTRLFINFKIYLRPSFSLVFLNSLAHLQHHKWDKIFINEPTKFCLLTIDKILGMIFKTITEDEALIVTNGLSQKNVQGENYCIYRQKNPSDFLLSIGISFIDIEQCMTNESHIFFKTIEEKEKATEILSNVRFGDQCLFDVEIDKINSLKLYYQFDYFDFIEPNSKFNIGSSEYDFYEYFTLLARRTGSHVPEGDLFSKGIKVPDLIKNHLIKKYIINYYKC